MEDGYLRHDICPYGRKNVSLPYSDSTVKESAYNAEDLSLIPGQEDLLEKEMAAHSSILVWRIPWTEKPGRLQSMASQRVGHNLTTKQK